MRLIIFFSLLTNWREFIIIRPVITRKKTTSSLLLAILLLAVVVVPAFAKGMWNKATIMWKAVPNAVSYNVYYKESNNKTFDHAVRNVNATMITINALKPGRTYWYRISALDGTGSEFWWSPVKKLPTMPAK